MAKVEQYFDDLKEQPAVRRVFLASDDPKVITMAKAKYSQYEIMGDPSVAETAAIGKRYTDASLKGIVMDIYLLSLCDFLVCTFSSQVSSGKVVQLCY